LTDQLPFHARLKAATIDAVECAGGVEAAAATTLRSKSTTGRWHSRNDDDLPNLSGALALDRVAVLRGAVPHITRAMARELGLSLVAHRQVEDAGFADLLAAQVAIVREGGDVQVVIAQALSDGKIDRKEANAIRSEIADLIDELTRLDRKLQGMAG